MGGNGKLAPPLALHSKYLFYLVHANRGIGHLGGIINPSKISYFNIIWSRSKLVSLVRNRVVSFHRNRWSV